MKGSKIGAFLQRARPLLHLVTIASLIYVGFVAYRNFSALADLEIPGTALVITLGLAPIYGMAMLLQAEIWHRLVGLTGPEIPGRALSWPTHTDTQLAKYLPGNVFHIVTRHLRLQQGGWSHGMLFRAFVIETALLITGALLVAVLALSAFGAGQGTALATLWGSNGELIQFAVGMLSIGVIICGAQIIGNPERTALPSLMLALTLAAGFFAVSGCAFYLIADSVAPDASPALVGIAAIAWIAGFITPGAPGGLGPREAVLVLLAAPSMGEPAALIAIALYRCLTLLGDVICFLLGRMLYRQNGSTKN